jgi:uncharacterized protein
MDQLDALLLAIPMDRDGMLLSEFDGFCAGLIVSPDMIMPSEWLPLVWGAGDAPFDELSDVGSATNLIMHHYNDVARMLTPPRSDYVPLYDEDTVTNEILWEPWVWGFEQAMRLRPEAWDKIVVSGDAEASASVNMMLALHNIAEGRSELPQASVEDLTEKAPDLIPDLVMALNNWAKGRSLSSGMSANANQMPAAGKKVGRNDPCSCGSGRKYKRCCGAH